mgnify:CR=1 FL=1
MDHQAFAQLLGNYGEFFGAIAVVATLVYLTIQVRQHSQHIDASTRTSAAAAWAEWRMSIARDRELADLYRKGLRGRSDLDAVDKMRFDVLINSLLFAQWGSVAGGRRDLGAVLWILRAEGARDSYEAQKAALLPKDLVEALDAALEPQ